MSNIFELPTPTDSSALKIMEALIEAYEATNDADLEGCGICVVFSDAHSLTHVMSSSMHGTELVGALQAAATAEALKIITEGIDE